MARSRRLHTGLTVTDQFCGAGGSSIGATAAGATLVMAMNHWQVAIDTHSQNFPNAEHAVADIQSTDPRRFPYTDILITSPECTNHSRAKSKNGYRTEAQMVAEERSRATMFDVARWADTHEHPVIIVENVIEAAQWRLFPAWLKAMEDLDYVAHPLFLNSMINDVPQSRDRMYWVFVKKHLRQPDLDFRPTSYCPNCEALVEGVQTWKKRTKAWPIETWGRYKQQYTYSCSSCHGRVEPLTAPAASAIDWSITGQVIGDRDTPLKDATRARIEKGLEKFADLPPMIMPVGGNRFERGDYSRCVPTYLPMNAVTTSATQALVVPVDRGNDPHGKRARSVWEAFATQTGRLESGIAIPPAMFLKNYGSIAEAHYRAHPVSSPLGAITTNDSHAVVTLPMVVEMRGGGSYARPASEPLATVTAEGNHHYLVVPPTWYLKNYGTGNDPSMAHRVDEPFGTFTAQDHHSLVQMPMLASYYGNGDCSPIDRPVPTVTTKDRHALVVPERAEWGRRPQPSVDDCTFRMLEPHEIGRAMSFPESYRMTGNKRERVRQYGNAVTPPIMKLIMDRVVEILDVKRAAA